MTKDPLNVQELIRQAKAVKERLKKKKTKRWEGNDHRRL